MSKQPEGYKVFKQNVINHFKGAEHVSDDQLWEILNIMKSLYKKVDVNEIFADLRKTFNEFYEGAKFLEGPNKKVKKWLKPKKEDVTWNFWERYERFLLNVEEIDPRSVDNIDKDTDEILTRLGDPTSDHPFSVKGLVVGHVQSGKTANFIGLLNKSADAGYRLIIVFAGIHNNLRAQTQLRIDEGFVGFDSKDTRDELIKGVGHEKIPVSAISLTSSDDKGDFSKGRAKGLGPSILNTKHTVVFVCKKNVATLTALITWLKKFTKKTDTINYPALIVDDEADNASINTAKQKKQVSETNKKLRTLLKLFNQKSYIGYTATPFANIFIPHVEETEKEFRELEQDLFPEDFIATLNPPPNYVGAKQFFGLDAEPDSDIAGEEYHTLPEKCIIEITDHTAIFPHPIRTAPLPKKTKDLPESLNRAIKCFLIACAVRHARGQTKEHNSMLVHIALYNVWQERIKELVETQVKNYSRIIRDKVNGKNLLKELKELYENEFVPVTRDIVSNFRGYTDPLIYEVPWKEVEKALIPVTGKDKLQVMEVHGKSKDVLDYEDYREHGINVIAVGGNKLSRGLTLRGLSISYYLRAAGTYDTLMQMGRWFGYRPGYLDVCKLFISKSLITNFKYVTLASEELRADFKYLWETEASPRDFGLKVRTHPSGLQVTAANKRSGAIPVDISFSNRLKESYKLLAEKSAIEKNIKCVNDLFEELPRSTSKEGDKYLFWDSIDAEKILGFFENFQEPDETTGSPVQKITDYITDRNENGELKKWSIALVNNKSGKKVSSGTFPKLSASVGMTLRNSDTTHAIYQIKKAHIISREHEWVDLSEPQYKWALGKTIESWENAKSKKKKPDVPSGHWIRKARGENQRGLLLLYPLNPEGHNKGKGLNLDQPIFGYAVSFPESNSTSAVRFLVRKDYYESLIASDNESED